MVGQGICEAIERSKDHEYDIFGDQSEEINLRFGQYSLEYEAHLRSINDYDVFIVCTGIRDEDINPEFNATEYKKNVKRFFSKVSHSVDIVYVSTARVFAEDQEPKYETSEPSPDSLYGEVHLAVEKIVLSHHPHSLIIRPQAVFNYKMPKLRRGFLVPNSFVETMVKGEKIVLRSSGSQVRNFVSSFDVGVSIIKALENKSYGVTHCRGLVNDSIIDFKNKLEALFDFVDKDTKPSKKVALEFAKSLVDERVVNSFSLNSNSYNPENIYAKIIEDVIYGEGLW